MRGDRDVEGRSVPLQLSPPVEAQTRSAAEAVLLEAQRHRPRGDVDRRLAAVGTRLLRLQDIGEVGGEA
jgi:hypothetical protein